MTTKAERIYNAKLAIKDATSGKGRDMTGVTFEGIAAEIAAIEIGVDTSDANAGAADILTAKSGYVNGVKITGTMPDNGTVSTDISAKATEVTIAAGKHSGSGIVKISAAEQAKIVATNIKKDVTILGVTGIVEELTTGTYKVRFIDFDGTILKTQLVNSGGSATAPTNPTHTYLTFSGWNATFTNITKDLDVGAIFSTTDGKSYIFVSVSASTGLSPTLYFNKANTALMTVDWGNGTTSTNSASGNQTFSNTYIAEGNYTITVACSGGYTFGQGSSNTQMFINNYASIATSVLIGANVTSLSNFTFHTFKSLTNISIPATITAIGNYVFNGCFSLIHCNIPLSVTTFGSNAFSSCYSLRSVTIPSSITSIGSSWFYLNYSLTSIVIPSSVTSIGSQAFQGCTSLAYLAISDSVISMGGNTFQSCTSLINADLSANCAIPDNAFYLCSALKSITIKAGITSIGGSSFNGCSSLSSIVMLASITSIGSQCFGSCPSLKSIVIPSSVTTIAASVFNACYNLIDVQILATTPPTLSTGVFAGMSLIARIYVPDASVAAYKAATNWVAYSNYIYPISSRP